MIIKISNLSVGIHSLGFEIPVDELQLGEPFVDILTLDCEIDKSQHQIVIKCNLTISTQLNCDRCGVDYNKDFISDFTLLYLYEKSDIDEDKLNVNYLSANDDKIDLTKDVLEFARLSIPMKKLCSEDCKGLCVKCGTDLNENKCNCSDDETNPVWGPLLKLKDKLN